MAGGRSNWFCQYFVKDLFPQPQSTVGTCSLCTRPWPIGYFCLSLTFVKDQTSFDRQHATHAVLSFARAIPSRSIAAMYM
jgi:hypothetical protein